MITLGWFIWYDYKIIWCFLLMLLSIFIWESSSHLLLLADLRDILLPRPVVAPASPKSVCLSHIFSASCRRKTDKVKPVYCQTLTEQRNSDRQITDSRVLSTLQFIEANTGELSGKLPTLFTNQQAALLASYPNCFWVICHISTLLCYIQRYDFGFWKSPVEKGLPNNKQYLKCDVWQNAHIFYLADLKRQLRIWFRRVLKARDNLL